MFGHQQTAARPTLNIKEKLEWVRQRTKSSQLIKINQMYVRNCTNYKSLCSHPEKRKKIKQFVPLEYKKICYNLVWRWAGMLILG